MTTTHAIEEELHVGLERVFAEAGFTKVSRPTPRRVVMRIDFPGSDPSGGSSGRSAATQ